MSFPAPGKLIHAYQRMTPVRVRDDHGAYYISGYTNQNTGRCSVRNPTGMEAFQAAQQRHRLDYILEMYQHDFEGEDRIVLTRANKPTPTITLYVLWAADVDGQLTRVYCRTDT